jgi:hypothetical protein
VARASLFFICTASYSPDPVTEFREQTAKQMLLIEQVLSAEGRRFFSHIAFQG